MPRRCPKRWALSAACADAGAELVTIGEDWTWEAGPTNLTGQMLTARRTADGFTLPDLHISLLGRHQLINTTTAVALIETLIDQGNDIPQDAIRTGLSMARWPGRFEVLNNHPAVVLDSAHNADSALKLRSTIDDVFPDPEYGRLAIIFGASADKDISGMLETFLSDVAGTFRRVDKIIATKSIHPRAANPVQLADDARRLCGTCPISVHEDVSSALTEALAWARPNDIICITGSIFVVARARQWWAEQHPDAFPPDDWVYHDETIGNESDEETTNQ